jgi:nucleotide-binding universal stress UspA family protein
LLKSIIVPLDGSGFGEHALPWAMSIARRAGARVQLVHVHSPLAAVYAEHPFWGDDSLESLLKQRGQTYLDHLVERLGRESSVSVTAAVLEGPITETLREHVEKSRAELVVLTSHGRGSVGRLWLGSVADDVIRHLTTPILVVKPQATPADLAADMVCKHFLVPLDGSDLAEQILKPAVELGSLMSAEYTLLRVIKPVMPMNYPTDGASLGEMAQAMLDKIDALHAQLKSEAESYLARIAARLREASLTVHTHVLLEQQTAQAIQLATEIDSCDLVALATHGRRALARLFLGSVADKIVRGATAPVLVQRPKVA